MMTFLDIRIQTNDECPMHTRSKMEAACGPSGNSVKGMKHGS